MAWVSPSTRTTGTLITAAIWNQDVVANPIAAHSMELLKANSGTDTSAGATNVDTIAMASGLTAKDTIVIYWVVEAVTQQTARPHFYNSTDSVVIIDCFDAAAALAAGTARIGMSVIRQRQAGATSVGAFTAGSSSNPSSNFNNPSFTTAYTGNWTLAFRHNGVTAGGTLQWTWAVYKVVGQ